MAKLAGIFISARNLRLMGAAVWLFAFAGACILLGCFAFLQVKEAMRIDSEAGLEQFARLSDHVEDTFEALRTEATAVPCSPQFSAQLRKVAYRPDGLNEFFYAPGGAVHCSVNMERFAEPVQFGEPDFVAENGTAFWVDRDISFAGVRGAFGTVVLREPFAVVVPSQTFELKKPSYMQAEAVLVAPNGRWWHRGGDASIYQDAILSETDRLWTERVALRKTVCLPDGFHCVAIRTPLASLVADNSFALSILLVLAGVIASWVSQTVTNLIRRYWSFEMRLLRNLTAESLVLAYQPIVDLQSGDVNGCEVLTRWRDLDDAIVYPDRFLPIIEKHKMTSRLTELVVQRAFEELHVSLPTGRRLQVNFNIFPCDLDAAKLISTFAVFEQVKDRFVIALEIIESDAVEMSTAQAHIEELRNAGFLVYIDDFGTGYSTLKQLAELEVDGVKLDRSFAMAPQGTLLSEMLSHAIGMVHAAGRAIVVEGVETAERLLQLQADAGRIDFAQGYFIARPLEITRFAGFLREEQVEAASVRQAA